MRGKQSKPAFRILSLISFVILGQLAAQAQPVEVIALTGTSWRYNQSNNLDGVMWMDPSYDDTQPGWQEGPALLSNDTGNGAIAPLIGTVINGPRVAAEGVLQHSYYFRTRFNWDSAPQPYVTMNFVTRIDDGAIIFLNGTEILRVSVDPDVPLQFASSDLANGYLCGGDADCDGVWSVTLETGSPLVQGENVLAAIVYQEGTDSSDITFGMRVTLAPPFAPTNLDPSLPADLVLAPNRSPALLSSLGGSPAPIYQWFVGDAPITDATNSTLVITNDTVGTSTSNFFVRATNPLGTVFSRTNTVIFTEDTNKPTVMVLSSLDGTNLIVRFNEKVESNSGGDSFNYILPGEFTLDSAALQDNQTDVLLGIHPAMAVGSTLEIAISGVEDLAGNLMDSTQVVVRAHVISYGCARYDLYLGLSTTAVGLGELTGAPAYPQSPSITRFKTNMELNTFDEFEGYGTRLTGFLIPPVGGDYVFYFHSDDNGQFSLSSDDSPDHLTLICNEPVWSGRRTWVGEAGGGGRVGVPSASGGPQANISGPINLAAGQMYYFEALMKEGGGGDNMGVNWQPPGGAEPVNDTPSIIPPEALASLADPVSQAANIKGPKVSLSVSGNQLTLSWQLPGYKLQSKSDLGTPGGWVDVPNGGTSPVTLTIGAGNQFYRISSP